MSTLGQTRRVPGGSRDSWRRKGSAEGEPQARQLISLRPSTRRGIPARGQLVMQHLASDLTAPVHLGLGQPRWHSPAYEFWLLEETVCGEGAEGEREELGHLRTHKTTCDFKISEG